MCACVCVCVCVCVCLEAALLGGATLLLGGGGLDLLLPRSRHKIVEEHRHHLQRGGGGERGSEGARERGREPFPEKRVYVTPPQTARRRERDGKSGKESENSEALNRGRESENSEMAQSRAACGYAFIAGVYVYVRAYGPVSCNPPPARSAFSPTPLSPSRIYVLVSCKNQNISLGARLCTGTRNYTRHMGARSQVQAGGNLAWRHLQGRPVGPRDDGLGSRERE